MATAAVAARPIARAARAPNPLAFGAIVVAAVADILKIHVHTDTPDAVFTYAARWGQVVQTKAEDMRAQHRKLGHPERRPVAVVCDSSADLADAVLDRHHIALIPLQVIFGEQVLRVETTPPENAGLGPDESGTFYYASPRRASKMRLVQLLRGGDTGLIYRAAGDVVTLGRDGNDINFPEDPFISGRHAQVAFGGAGLMLTDTGSKNGTFLRINGESGLHHGDYVFMGQQLLRVEIV